MKTTFRPNIDGFAFPNSWAFQPQERDTIWSLYEGAVVAAITGVLGLIPAIPLDPALLTTVTVAMKGLVDEKLKKDFGLCGGMAYASLDYYMANLVIQRGFSDSQPDYTTPQGSILRRYIWQRLADSFTSGNVAVTTLEWMAILHFVPQKLSGGASWLLRKTKDEWTKLKQHLDAGNPWPLGLIGTTTDPTENHQILAYGYEDNNDGTGLIYVYDNVCPDTESTIKLNFNGQELSAQETCGSIKRGLLQGFFCSSYQQSTPPVAVGITQDATVTPSPPGEGRKMTVSYTAANVGFGQSPSLQLYVRGIGQIPVNDGNGGAGTLKMAGSGPGGPPLHITKYIHFTSSDAVNNPFKPIDSPVSNTSPHSTTSGNTIIRQLAPVESSILEDGSWSFFPEVWLGNFDGVDIYKLLWLVRKPKDGKEGKDSKEKEKEKEASKDRKDNKESAKEKDNPKENAKEKDRDFAAPLRSVQMSSPAGILLPVSEHNENKEQFLTSGQAFIRPEERPDVGGRIVQQSTMNRE